MLILKDETLDELNKIDKKIIQKKKGFRFAIDAVLISNFIDINKESKVLDIGTGSAIIPLLLSENEEIQQIDAVEIQKEIADMAIRSIKYNELEDKIKIHNIDIKEYFQEKKYDFIVTNPPYMKKENGNISENEIKAISRHEIKINLKELLVKSEKLLKNGGSFNIIYRTDRVSELLKIIEDYRLYPKRLRFVYSKPGIGKSNLFMLEALKGKKSSLEILEPLYLFSETGEYTEEVKSYY
jgi:tRNA1(Val) A37 N6-methylase TrmN6